MASFQPATDGSLLAELLASQTPASQLHPQMWVPHTVNKKNLEVHCMESQVHVYTHP